MSANILQYLKTKNLRSLIYLTFLALRKVQNALFKPISSDQKIKIFPDFDSSNNAKLFVDRLNWYLPKLSGFEITKTDQNKYKIISERPTRSSVTILHDWKSLLKFEIWRDLRNVHILDPKFYWGVESLMARDIQYNSLSKNEILRFRERSKVNSKNLAKHFSNSNSSFLFLTGPSFSHYNRFQYHKDQLKIICNSTIKDTTFLEYIGGPDVLVFADPVFHFSPNSYSNEFRKDVLNVYNRYKPFIIIPETSVPLLLNHFPMLSDRIIGAESQKHFQIPNFETGCHLGTTGNILTYMMLPIAAALSKKIFIIGADGRQKNEGYFWQHSPNSQYTDKMKSVSELHPSFFRDYQYKDYYENHCKILEEQIKAIEQKGIDINSLTPSYIECLKQRMIRAESINTNSGLHYA